MAGRGGEAGEGAKDYNIDVFWSDEDDGYIADIPALDSCSAFGHTPAEALAEVDRVETAWLETARAHGKPIPSPRCRPVLDSDR